MTKLTYSIFTILLLAAACRTNTPQPTKVVENCIPIIDKPLGNTNDFSILSVLVEGDHLKMEVEYNAPDDTNVFMSWNGALMKSLPPKASVQVGCMPHRDDDDMRLVKRTICYDISKLRENTRKQGLVILIDGFDKPISIPAEK